MELDRVIAKRKMIRMYDQNRQVPEHLINKLLDNASRAPSAGQTQVQEFIVVKDPAKKRKLRKASVNQEQVEEAPVLVIVCSNTARSVGRYGQCGRGFYMRDGNKMIYPYSLLTLRWLCVRNFTTFLIYFAVQQASSFAYRRCNMDKLSKLWTPVCRLCQALSQMRHRDQI